MGRTMQSSAVREMRMASRVQKRARKSQTGRLARRGVRRSAESSVSMRRWTRNWRDAGWRGGVEAEEVEVAEGAEAGEEEALVEGDGEGGDGEDDHEGHLEAGFEEGAGVEDEDGEGGGAEGVEGGDLAVEPAGDEVDGRHEQGALGGDGEAGELGVGEGDEDGDEDGGAFGEAEAAEEPEEGGGEQGDVQAGDDEEVEGSGALEGEAEGVGEVGAVAEEHGVEHGGVFGGEAQSGGKVAAGVRRGEGLEAVGGPGLRGEDAAAEGWRARRGGFGRGRSERCRWRRCLR